LCRVTHKPMNKSVVKHGETACALTVALSTSVGRDQHRRTSPTTPRLDVVCVVPRHRRRLSAVRGCQPSVIELFRSLPLVSGLWNGLPQHVTSEPSLVVFRSRLKTSLQALLHGCAPSYLSDACKPAPEASRRLRWSAAITCVIPWSRIRLGDRSFDVDGPQLWNKLPASVRSSDSLCQFRRHLKTFLFV